MAPSKSLPAALHLELSEYASLLRTIRTNSTLDLVPHLSRPQSAAQSSDDGLEDDEVSNPSQQEIDFGGSQAHKEKEHARKSSGSGKRKRAKADDNWTRWPLLLEDCAIPEWGLDEEVKAIAERSLRYHKSSSGAPVSEATPADTARAEANDEPEISPALLSGLTSDSSSKLSYLLSLLALYRPNVTYTKHGRVDPMKWEDILEVAGIAEIFDKDVIEDVKIRMEEVFGPSGTQVVHHMQVIETSKRALAAVEAEFGQDLLSLVGPPPAKRRRTKKKRDADISSSDDVEAEAEAEATE